MAISKMVDENKIATSKFSLKDLFGMNVKYYRPRSKQLNL